MRPARLVAALLVAFLALAPGPALAHDRVSGTPDVTIRIGADGVSHRAVTVPVGGIVAFVNQDGERHRMRSRTKPYEFDTGDLEPGQRFLVRFGAEGTVPYADERTDDRAFAGSILVRSASNGARTPTTSAPRSTPTAVSITIGDRVFRPGSVTIAAGGTVTWTNRDDRAHTATSSGSGGIASPVLAAGQAYRKTFARPGTFAFLCAIHPEMRGTVKVVAASGASAAPAAPVAPAPTAASTATPAPSPTTASSTDPAAVDAAIVDFAFQPEPVTVAAGGTVTWVNRGGAPHTVTATDGSFDSQLLAAGATFSRRFETAGTYAFACAFHPEMQGVVSVMAADAQSSTRPPTTAPPAAAVAPPPSAAPPAFVPPEAAAEVPGAVGRLLVIGLVVVLNLGAVLLFARTISGAMGRRPA